MWNPAFFTGGWGAGAAAAGALGSFFTGALGSWCRGLGVFRLWDVEFWI